MRTAAEREDFRCLRADEMRRWPTRAEAKLIPHLEPLGFEFQVSLDVPRQRGGTDGVIMDFYHRRSRLCVEVDGGVHRSRRGPDARRDRWLLAVGIRTVRVTNAEVLDQRRMPAALERIIAALNAEAGK